MLRPLLSLALPHAAIESSRVLLLLLRRRRQQQQQQHRLSPTPFTRSFATLPPHQELVMPAMSPTMSHGSLVRWHKSVGDKVNVGDVFVEIETDKATVDFEAQEDGFVAAILVNGEAKDVPVGQPLLVVVEDESSVAAFKDYRPMAEKVVSPPPSATAAPPPSTVPKQSIPSPTPTGSHVVASPMARRVAREAGVQLSETGGSGSWGMITSKDLTMKPPSAPPTSPPPQSMAFTDIPMNNIRKVIARRLLESKQTIPHYYLTIDCRVDKLLQVRSRLKTEFAASLSVNDFIIKACAMALRKVPTVNAQWTEDSIREYKNVDVSVAVNTENGLITPIIHNADSKGLGTISQEMRDLAQRGRAGKLQLHEFQGGTFTLSNLGMFGIKQFAAVINPPQAAILAVGAAEKRPILEEGETTADTANFSVGTFITVTLSCDHRVVDGAMGAEWLQAFKRFVENPVNMLF